MLRRTTINVCIYKYHAFINRLDILKYKVPPSSITAWLTEVDEFVLYSN